MDNTETVELPKGIHTTKDRTTGQHLGEPRERSRTVLTKIKNSLANTRVWGMNMLASETRIIRLNHNGKRKATHCPECNEAWAGWAV